MTMLEFEKSIIKYDIKFTKKILKLNWFSMAISIVVIVINVPTVIYHPERWYNSIAIGMMIFNLIFCYMDWRVNFLDLKELYHRQTMYKKFELQNEEITTHPRYLFDPNAFRPHEESPSDLPKW